jgi:hypothetical protein
MMGDNVPYQPNSPRFEFSGTDRTTLQTISLQALAMMNGVSPSAGTKPVKRSDFDAWKNLALGLTPTFNNTGPWPDTR